MENFIIEESFELEYKVEKCDNEIEGGYLF
jgi:hypothetical protein